MATRSGDEAEGILVWRAGEEVSSHSHRLAGMWDVRGPAASVRRDALFRRGLVLADILAFMAAYALALAVPGGKTALSWGIVIGIPVIVVVRKADRPIRPRRDADAQDDARRGAEAVPARDVVRAGRLARGRRRRARRLRPPRRAVPVAACSLASADLARAAARAIALRLAPTERCLFIGDELSAETIRAKLTGHGGVKARGRRPPRSRQGRAVVHRRLLRAPAGGDPRARADARRAPRDHRAAQRRRRRDAQPSAHAEGGRRERQRSAAPARGRRLLGRVRRPARRHGDGRPAL